MLEELLSKLPRDYRDPNLLVGNEHADDAAVYRLNGDQALIATTDFFMPIVDDPYDFGRMAAANALSDVYAMGGKPIMALAIAGIPAGKLAPELVQQIFAGGHDVCREAGIVVAGGHTIDIGEPIYGLVAMGLVHPDKVRANSAAQAGDVLVLGKPLGIGILGAAANKDELDPDGYRQMVDTATRLNRVGARLSEVDGVHAMTDVTGFGLLGHLGAMARESGVTACLDQAKIPAIDPRVLELIDQGCVPGGTKKNLAAATCTCFADDVPEAMRLLLADAQTSGGLLLAVAPAHLDEVLRILSDEGTPCAEVIGTMAEKGPCEIEVS